MSKTVIFRKSNDRGLAEHGWLHSRHTFSFANYYDPKYMGFGALRVINEDQIEGGSGFESHSHKDMEIISYVIRGALEHQDSMKNKTVIRPGEIQRMSAGTGVTHSEFNHLKDGKTHFLQIWIMPDKKNYPPSYEQMNFESKFARGDFALVASHRGRDHSISLHQDVDIYVGRSKPGATVVHKTDPHRKIWIQLVSGTLGSEGRNLEAGDGIALEEASKLELTMGRDSEFILFDLPA